MFMFFLLILSVTVPHFYLFQSAVFEIFESKCRTVSLHKGGVRGSGGCNYKTVSLYKNEGEGETGCKCRTVSLSKSEGKGSGRLQL